MTTTSALPFETKEETENKQAEVLVLYHSADLDGYCSGAVCKKYYETVLKKTVQCIGVNYNEPPVTIHKDQIVVMCDMSYEMEDMARIVEGCRRFTWIDHHQTAIDKYNQYIHDHYPDNLPKGTWDVYHKVGISASELCWQYFFKHEQMPPAVELLGKYDTWREYGTDEWKHYILPFQYGMRLERALPEHEIWQHSLLKYDGSAPKVNNIIAQGEVVLRYQRQQNEMACKYASFEREFAGFKAICLNVAGANLTFFESIWDEEKYDIAIAFAYTGKHWKYTLLTSKNIDLGTVARNHGGGGHKKAAGFTSLTNLLT